MKIEPINILVVDDHSMVVEGMKNILSLIPNVHLEATANNAFEAMEILEKQVIDLVFLDINLPDISGIELCIKIKKEFPEMLIIGLSTFKQRSYVSQMINNGASGYLLKSAGKDEIELAINSIRAGNMFFSKEISNSINEPILKEEVPTLTRREREILTFISAGLTNNQIAEKLFLSNYTVDTHRKNLLAKFEVSNTALLITMAAKFGIV